MSFLKGLIIYMLLSLELQVLVAGLLPSQPGSTNKFCDLLRMLACSGRIQYGLSEICTKTRLGFLADPQDAPQVDPDGRHC